MATIGWVDYACSGGVPVTRLGSASTIPLTSIIGWRTGSTISQAMSNGVVYVVSMGEFTDNDTTVGYDEGSVNDSSDGTGDSLPATWTNPGDGSLKVGVYATYEAAAVAPTVTTQNPINITSTTATGNGNVTSDGGSTITERGTVWSASANPTTADNKFTSAGTTGAFTTSMTGFSNDQTYHVRAYATNAVDTSYGADVQFTTHGVIKINPSISGRFIVNSTSNTPAGPAGSSLVGYWSFNGANTNWTSAIAGTTNDLSGNNNTGTLTNMSRTASVVPGISGQGLSFDGVDDSIVVSDHASLRPGNGSWTVTIWAKLPNTNQTSLMFQKRLNVSPNTNYALFVGNPDVGDSKKLYAFYIGSGATGVRGSESTADVVDGNWHQYTMVADKTADVVRLYKDGVELTVTTDNSGTWPTVDNTDPMDIGAATVAGLFYVNGPMDELRIYNRALGAGEITELYNLGVRRIKVKAQ